MKCSNCGFDAPPDMRFCGQCGARLGVTCPNCGFENPFAYRFCGKCGSRLESPPAPLVPELAPPAGEATHGRQATHTVPTPEAAPLAAAPEAGAAAVTPLAGERRIATIILADVYRSTDLMEQLGTETWVQLMNQVLQLLAAEVYRFGGRVDQFRGDGLVAFFGATDAHEDDPERALLAALAMQQALQPAAVEMQRRGIDLKARVGVNTGEVIVARVGEAGTHREDTAMGEGVALAARMETAAEPGTVLVSPNTYPLVKSKFEWQPLGEMTVKGIARPLAVYRPLRARTLTYASTQTHGLTLPLTGREKELQTLVGCIEALRSGRGGIALVMGEKGLGKSLLIERLRQHFDRLAETRADAGPPQETQAVTPAVTWLFEHCRSYDQSTPYALWLGLLRNWLETPGEEPGPDLSDLLRRRVEALWGDAWDQYYPYLATLFSLPIGEAWAERLARLKAEELQRQLAQALYSWIEALTQQGPLVVALNDLQWADASSLELLKQCLRISDSAPVLWLATFRPDRSAPVWEFRHHVETEYPHRLTSVNLPPLTERESHTLIDQMIGHETLADETAALIVQKAEGNPYYLCEIVFALIDRGVVAQDATGVWRQTQPIQSLDLPGSLRSLLITRMDRLTAEERRVLQIAAVIGPLFSRTVLEAVAGEGSQIGPCLTNLQRAQLIHEHSLAADLGMEYSFTPSLVRDVVYDSLLSTQRAAYHLQVAERIEEIVSPECCQPYHGLLAYHFHQAGHLKKELFHALGAADEARRVYANAEALEHYSRALALLDQLESQPADEEQRHSIRELRFEALEGRRQVQHHVGNIRAGHADARALLQLAREMADDPAFLVDALLVQPEVAHPETQSNLEAALATAQEALALAQHLGDKRREMRALVAVAGLRHLLRDSSWPQLAHQALELTRQLGDVRTEVGLLLGLGGAYGMDNLPRSMEYLEAALAISKRLDDKETEASLLAALSPQFERSGDYHRQLVEFEEKRVSLNRTIGNQMGEGNALMGCGQIRAIYLGDYQGGLALLQEALGKWKETSDKLFPLLRIAQIQALLGQLAEAWSSLAAARSAGERVILDISRAGLCLVEAILHNAEGGEEHWRKVLELQGQVAQMVVEERLSRQYQMAAACEATAAHLGLARTLTEADERTRHQQWALEASHTALAIYQEFGFTQTAECVGEEILFRHSLALAANQQHAAAQEFLGRAYAEMMRKYDLIPADSPFRQTFRENIALHRQIQTAYEAASASQII